jgi:hypothetical protein
MQFIVKILYFIKKIFLASLIFNVHLFFMSRKLYCNNSELIFIEFQVRKFLLMQTLYFKKKTTKKYNL